MFFRIKRFWVKACAVSHSSSAMFIIMKGHNIIVKVNEFQSKATVIRLIFQPKNVELRSH